MHKNRKELDKLIIIVIIYEMFSLAQLFFWVCHVEFHNRTKALPTFCEHLH